MNRKVKRYDPINSDGTCGMCVEDADYGAYVEFADYAALEAELAKMRAVLDGFVLVPVEPTLEMANASVYNGTDYTGSFDFDDFKKDWTDILAAAPARQQVECQECERLRNTLLEVTTRHFAESWNRRASDKELEQYLSAGIAQLEGERDQLRAELDSIQPRAR